MPPSKRSCIFLHYEVPDDASDSFIAKCRYCFKKMKGSAKATTNLINHVKRHHPHVQLHSTKAARSDDLAESRQTVMTGFAVCDKKWNHSDPRQQRSNSKLINLMSAKLLPLSFVEGPEIREFVESLNTSYNIPTRKTVQKLLADRCDFLHQKIDELIKSTQSVCITVDLWSSRNMRSYIGVTGHMIVNYELHSVLLACKRVKGRHTAENISSHYEDIVSTYDVSNKIATIVTDNATNMVKAFDLPGYDSTSSASSETEPDSDCCEPVDCEGTGVLGYLPDHERCFTHSLQLVVKDGLQAASRSTNAISKASAIVSHVRKSTISTEVLEGESKLQAAVPTRWNSQVKMVRSILAIPKEKIQSLELNSRLTESDRDILQEFIEIMTPFEEATDRTQGQNIVTASSVIPVIRGLRHHLTNFKASYNNSLVKACLASLNKRLTTFEDKMVYQRAAVLDPRFKLRWCSLSEVEVVKSDLVQLIPTGAAAIDATQPPPKKRPCLFSFMENNNEQHSSEVDAYLNENCINSSANPLIYWKDNEHRMPGLAKLSRRFLCITASSAPVERVFSTAGKIFRPDRANMTDNQFEMLMYTKCNGHMM